MTAQLQYRRNVNDQNNVFPTLADEGTGSAFTLPVSLNIQHRRSMHNVNVNYSRTESQIAESVRVRRGRRRKRRHHRRLDRPVRLGRAAAVVLDVYRRARCDADAAHGSALHVSDTGGRGRSAPSTRCTSAATTASTSRTTRPMQTRAARSSSPDSIRPAVARPCAAAALDFADFLLGMPQQATRPVRSRQRAHVRANR